MAAHDYHDALKGYNPNQVLVDGCHVCEERSHDMALWLQMTDEPHFLRACERAVAYWEGTPVVDISYCETRIYSILGPILRRLQGMRI